ncbi:hypothetical protein DFH09DRAFT_1174948, partial [Mycena vulgaris]
PSSCAKPGRSWIMHQSLLTIDRFRPYHCVVGIHDRKTGSMYPFTSMVCSSALHGTAAGSMLAASYLAGGAAKAPAVRRSWNGPYNSQRSCFRGTAPRICRKERAHRSTDGSHGNSILGTRTSWLPHCRPLRPAQSDCRHGCRGGPPADGYDMGALEMEAGLEEEAFQHTCAGNHGVPYSDLVIRGRATRLGCVARAAPTEVSSGRRYVAAA